MPLLEQGDRSGETAPATREKPPSTGGGSTTSSPAPAPTPSTTTVSEPAPEPASSEAIREYVLNNYGYLAWAIEHPELGPILLQAAADGSGEQELFSALQKTIWWQENEQSVRDFQRREKEDPATVQAQIADAELSARIFSRRMGINVSPERMRELATDFVRLGWSTEELQRAVSLEATYNPDAPVPTGDLAATQRQLQTLASQWMVPLSDRSAFEFAKSITLGESSVDAFQEYLADQAESRFPQLANHIRSGVSPGSFFDPYKQTISQLMDVPVSNIDLVNDPRWSRVIDFNDDRSGQPRPMTLSELQVYVRKQPEWKKTRGAVNQAAELAEFIGRRFGSVA